MPTQKKNKMKINKDQENGFNMKGVLHRLYIEPSCPKGRRDRQIEQQRASTIARLVSPRPKNPVTIIIGVTEVLCDLELLQRNTKFFASGKPGMAYGLPVCDVSLQSFLLIYQWMASPDEVVPPKLLMSVYRAAVYLEITVLIEQFMEEFKDPQTAREEIGFYMYYGLHKLNVYVPFRKTLRVHKYFLTLIGTNEYLELWPNAVMQLLSSQNICVNSEVEVLIAAILWLHHDYDTRQIHTDLMLECVNFDSIPLEALLQMRQRGSANGLAQMLYRPEVEMFLKRAPSHNNNIRYCNRRIWVYDQLCNYHHDAHCPQRNFITLGQFVNFQSVLRIAPNLHWYYRHQLNPYVHSCRHEVCRRMTPPSGRR